MYYILWASVNGTRNWILIAGEDMMQVFVSELVDGGADAENIIVFNADSEIR